MTINNWLKDERPREKLLTKGAAALSNSELLAILLRIGKKGKTAVDLARELLIKFDGLNNLFSASKNQVCKSSGIGVAKYVQLHAAIEIARRYLQNNLENKDVLNNSSATKNYLLSKLKHHEQEVFACLFLDNKNRIICYEELFFGTINNSTVHPREIVKRALAYNAAAIIFAHNHPSGISEPSEADKYITNQLINTLKLVDIRVLDHIIVSNEGITSFLEQNLL